MKFLGLLAVFALCLLAFTPIIFADKIQPVKRGAVACSFYTSSDPVSDSIQ